MYKYIRRISNVIIRTLYINNNKRSHNFMSVDFNITTNKYEHE